MILFHEGSLKDDFCFQTGPFVRLQMGQETSFYVDNEAPSHCFTPCGHMASESTVKYVSFTILLVSLTKIVKYY